MSEPADHLIHPTLSVLILDDDTFLLELIGDMLREHGISDIRAMSDAGKALETIQSRHPDILLCDLNMPNVDGIEFIRQLASEAYSGNIVIMSNANLSVLRAAESLARVHGLNFISILSKPFDTRTLALALTREKRSHLDDISVPGIIEPITAEELRSGLGSGCLTLQYQPKVSTQILAVPDIECLARWKHPTRGILPPLAFIEVAEKSGLIDTLTLEVLRLAAEQLRLWQQDGLNVRLAINISMNSLHRLDLPEIYEEIILSAGVSTSQFILEVTESRLITDLTLTLDILTRLRLKGFDLAIDDFGTGYSTLDNLRRLPFSELKLDHTFVSGITSDKTKRAILESSVRLGKALNLNLVAEGVETREEWDLICALGCHEVQGYFVTPPLPPQAIPGWISGWEMGGICKLPINIPPPEMSPSSGTVLLVDNNQYLQNEIIKHLQLHYLTLTAESGEDAIIIATSEKPDVILLDTNLPGMDGFETCRKLSENEMTADIPVIFLSAFDMLEDKLQGYEAGATDYLSKPVSPLEVRAKIAHILKLADQHKNLRSMANYASTTAMTAMTSMGELGILLNALRTFNTCSDYTSLADAMLESLLQYGLSAVVQIRTEDVAITRNEYGSATPLEVSVIEHMAGMDRIFQFKSRMSYTYENVSLMVNNAPTDDPDRCGRLRDHLAMLVESAEMRVRSIVNTQELKRREAITLAIEGITDTLNAIDKTQRECRVALYLATSSMNESIEKEIWALGLTETQDVRLTTLVNNNIEKILSIQYGEVDIQNKLTGLITTLKSI